MQENASPIEQFQFLYEDEPTNGPLEQAKREADEAERQQLAAELSHDSAEVVSIHAKQRGDYINFMRSQVLARAQAA